MTAPSPGGARDGIRGAGHVSGGCRCRSAVFTLPQRERCDDAAAYEDPASPFV